MGTRAFAVLVAVVFGGVIGACKSDLRDGRCDKDSDCDSKKCDLSEQGNGRCVPEDGGSGDAKDGGGEDASDAGDAHDAFSCEVATCGGETPVCDMAMMKCRKCGAASECMTLNAPVCAPSGACVACVASTDCLDAEPICTVATNTCAKCTDDGQCKARAPTTTTPACAASGKCVECTKNDHCGPTSTKPVCDTAMNTCAGCKAGGTECATINSTKPACAASGACVECVSNADCKGATPICDKTSNTCKPCKADSECTEGPKVCMNHLDGRCASDPETIYVQAGGTCTSTVGATNGTLTIPYCSLEPAATALGTMTAKTLIVVRGPVGSGPPFAIASRPISIVGQMNAGVAGSIRLSAGELYLRRITLSAGTLLVGCQADAGSTLHLDHVVVTGNKGGIALRGAAFDIQNTTVVNNEPFEETDGTTTWGGIYVQNPPAAGPTKFQFVTVQNNKAPGIFCSGAAQGTGVLASGNTLTQVTTSCGFTSCGTASATCGAQP